MERNTEGAEDVGLSCDAGCMPDSLLLYCSYGSASGMAEMGPWVSIGAADRKVKLAHQVVSVLSEVE